MATDWAGFQASASTVLGPAFGAIVTTIAQTETGSYWQSQGKFTLGIKANLSSTGRGTSPLTPQSGGGDDPSAGYYLYQNGQQAALGLIEFIKGNSSYRAISTNNLWNDIPGFFAVLQRAGYAEDQGWYARHIAAATSLLGGATSSSGTTPADSSSSSGGTSSSSTASPTGSNSNGGSSSVGSSWFHLLIATGLVVFALVLLGGGIYLLGSG